MFRLYPNEQFRQIDVDAVLHRKYAISNKGRMVSYTTTPEDGRLLKGSATDGYRTLRFEGMTGNKQVKRSLFHYKLVALHFLPKTADDQEYVLHLDYIRDNDDSSNLRWATRGEMLEHMRNSPHVKRAKQNLIEHNIKSDGWKLTATKVMLIKKLLANPLRKTRLKMLAKQFGISETHLKRIERGENWGHIKI